VFLYFYLLDQVFFSDVLRPALARSLRERSFAPCQDLCSQVLLHNRDMPPEALVHTVASGLAFERKFWQALVGECLVHGAVDIPRLQTAPDTLTCLLAPDHYGVELPRDQYAPIEQAHFGTRDLVFGGGHYRPDHAGLNDSHDIIRLANYLKNVDATIWSVRDLDRLAHCNNEEDRAEELADACDWWPGLVELYRRARDERLVVVCESV